VYASLVLSSILLMLFATLLPAAILKTLGLGPRYDLVTVVKNKVWTHGYSQSNSVSTIIRGKDGKLWIRSPPPIKGNEAVLTRIKALGDVAVVYGTHSHDSHVDQWIEAFPGATMMAPKRDTGLISARQQVDVAIEDAVDVRANFGLEIVDNPAQVFADPFILVDVGEPHGSALLLPCGFATFDFNVWNPVHWLLRLSGFAKNSTKVSYIRLFSFLFSSTEGMRKAEPVIAQLCALNDVRIIIPLHGPARFGAPNAYLGGLSPIEARRFF